MTVTLPQKYVVRTAMTFSLIAAQPLEMPILTHVAGSFWTMLKG
jgi:hypothetical protein